MNNVDALSNASAILAQWQVYWVVPVGMLLLYFYGRVHFNTPGYALVQNDEHGQPLCDPGRLLSLAPPMFTTTRSRFNRYAWRYVLLLEIAFLAILFLPSVFSDAGRILEMKWPLPPSSESLQYRTLFALFLLTGLLSSFPVLKDLDGHILKALHTAAYIPEDATRLAEILREARFVASAATRSEVEAALTKRDTLAVSRGESMGTLEAMLLKALWLRVEFLRLTTQEGYMSFRLALSRDISDVAASFANLRPTLIDYFDTQERMITTPGADIDATISANRANPQFADLNDRREQLTRRCIALFQRMCLLMALLVYGTKTTPAEMGKTMREVGFQIDITATPAWDWNTLARVVGSVFGTLIITNVMLLYIIYFWKINNAWSFSLTRSTMLLDAIVDTLPFALVLLITIRGKRSYRLNPGRSRPENLLVAVYGFFATAVYYTLSQLALGSGISIAPLLLAATPAIGGYFTALYVDRALAHQGASWSLVCWQAIVQGLGTAMAIFFASSIGDPLEIVYVVGYAAVQSTLVGSVMGYLFQRFYEPSEFVSKNTLADIAYRPLQQA